MPKGDYNGTMQIKRGFPRRKMEECKMATATITKDTIIGEILDLDQSTAPYFLEMGMHCQIGRAHV